MKKEVEFKYHYIFGGYMAEREAVIVGAIGGAIFGHLISPGVGTISGAIIGTLLTSGGKFPGF